MRLILPATVFFSGLGMSSALAQTASIQSASMAEMAADCRCDVIARAGDTPEDIIEFALSTMWIDAWETEEVRKGGQLFLTGEVETENGSRDMVATLIGTGQNRVVRVALDEVGKLDMEKVMQALIKNSSVAPKSQPKTVKAKPKFISPKPKVTTKSKSNSNPFVGLKYPAPELVKVGPYSNAIGNWTKSGNVLMAKPRDALSPRETTRTFTPRGKPSDRRLIDDALKQAGLTRANYTVENLEVTQRMTGARVIIAFGAARRKGKIVRFFASSRIDKAGAGSSVVFEAPQDEWNSWGGLAVVLSKNGVRKPSEFTPALLASARTLTPKQETAIYEKQYTELMVALFKGTIAANMGALTTMRSFNMATANCAGDANCTVTDDGVGGYQAETK